eukprot:TCONS_00064679-protein
MAAAKKNVKKVYTDIDEILDVVFESDNSDIDLGDESNSDSDWEYDGDDQVEENDQNLPVEDPPNVDQADNSPDSEEEMDIDDNEINDSIPEETDESVVESDSGSEDDEPLARFAQRNLPNNRVQAIRGRANRGRGRGPGRGIQRGAGRVRGGRRFSLEGNENPNLVERGRGRAQGQRRGRARGFRRRGRGCGRGVRGRQQARGVDNADQPADDIEDPEGDLDWTNIELDQEVTENDDFLFLENEGLNVRLDPNSSELDFLELYLTDKFYNEIVRETNRFAAQFIESNPDKEESRYVGSWSDVTKEEIKAFLALIIMMGIVHKPDVNSYWSLDELLSTPSFSTIMNRDRFKLILKFLHFNDNSTYDPQDPDRDRLHKVRPILDILRNRFRTVYNPGKTLALTNRSSCSKADSISANTSRPNGLALASSYTN